MLQVNELMESAILADKGIDIQQFADRWDAAHLSKLQANWDGDTRDESEKGSRPTSYSS